LNIGVFNYEKLHMELHILRILTQFILQKYKQVKNLLSWYID